MFWRLWAAPQKDTSGRAANCEIFMAPTCIGSLFMKWVGAFALRCLFFSATYHFCHRLRFGFCRTKKYGRLRAQGTFDLENSPMISSLYSFNIFYRFFFVCHTVVRITSTVVIANITSILAIPIGFLARPKQDNFSNDMQTSTFDRWQFLRKSR